MDDEGRPVSSLIYTIDPSIFILPPNNNVLHAANETDLTQPDVFGVPSCQMGQALFVNSMQLPLPPNESNLTGSDTAVRSDSATSHEMKTMKPEKEVDDGSIDQDKNPGSIKRLMLLIFKCVKRSDAESVKGKQRDKV